MTRGAQKRKRREPRIGVGALVVRRGHILLIRRRGVHGDGTWSTPGGHLDFGESPEQCAIREVLEETGVVIDRPVFRGITNDCFVEESRHYVTLWIQAEHVSGEARIGAPEEMSEAGWFRLDTLPKPLFLSLRNLVDDRCAPAGIFAAIKANATTARS
jgi:8-oxo-dGTP diphosphatase